MKLSHPNNSADRPTTLVHRGKAKPGLLLKQILAQGKMFHRRLGAQTRVVTPVHQLRIVPMPMARIHISWLILIHGDSPARLVLRRTNLTATLRHPWTMATLTVLVRQGQSHLGERIRLQLVIVGPLLLTDKTEEELGLRESQTRSKKGKTKMPEQKYTLGHLTRESEKFLVQANAILVQDLFVLAPLTAQLGSQMVSILIRMKSVLVWIIMNQSAWIKLRCVR
jgi:hypothetical protein